MPVIPNLRRTLPRAAEGQAPPTPLTYVDTPAMDYVAWLSGSGDAIAKYPGDASARRVAVVGSGGGGLAAAYELLRCGFDVTVFEATDRIGGRLFTLPSATGDGNVFEMGAMRFTPSEQVLHYYADLFNASGASTITFDQGPFPDPGVNLTYIAFQGNTYVWDPANPDPSSMPPSYQTVNDGWTAFMEGGFTSADGTIVLEAPAAITAWLADPAANRDRIVAAWTAYVDAFVNASLYEAMVRIFTDPNAPGGTAWNETDFEFFGALGTGFGGFGPLFPICFLDILRFVINAVDSDQHELVTGVQSIVDGFLNQPITRPDGTVTTVGENVIVEMPVTGVTSTGQAVTLTLGDGTVQSFDRAVIATSHRSMELTMGLGAGAAAGALSEPVSDAVRRVHLACSSKVFVESAAFWDEANPAGGSWPRNVVGDTILRNLYTLTYPDAPPGTGALLFSYTWEDDSVKQQTFTDAGQRVQLLLRDLQTISAPLAGVVEQSLAAGTAQVIDWQSKPFYFGAFKLNQPGQDAYVASLFYDFLKAGQSVDTGVYLAGDSIGFLGGWVENALQTGVNAAAGVAVSLGATLTNADQGPFACLDPALYDYAVVEPVAAARVQVPGIVADAAAVGD